MNFLELTNSLNIGPLTITFYALCILTGMIIAVYTGYREAHSFGVPSNFIFLGVVIIIPIAIVCAR